MAKTKQDRTHFTIAGFSTVAGETTRMRFANDLVNRIKVLSKGGHEDINLFELPNKMTKPEIVAYFASQKGTDSPIGQLLQTNRFLTALGNAEEKYTPQNDTLTRNGKPKQVKTEISLDSIRAKVKTSKEATE